MKKKIMVVDGSGSMRQLVSFALEDSGYSVVTAVNGQDALDRMKSNSLSLVITDLEMPVMDGIDLIKQMRAEDAYRLMPVILLTSDEQDDKRQDSKLAGASAWITKPFRPEELLNVVSKLVV